MTFRRKDKVDGGLTADAEAWRDEAKRRVKLKKGGEEKASLYGNLIRVLGEDVHDKTEGIEDVVVNVGDTLSEICGEADSSFTALLLSPKIVSEEEAEELAGKNNSSIVMQFSLAAGEKAVDEQVAARFLTGAMLKSISGNEFGGETRVSPRTFHTMFCRLLTTALWGCYLMTSIVTGTARRVRERSARSTTRLILHCRRRKAVLLLCQAAKSLKPIQVKISRGASMKRLLLIMRVKSSAQWSIRRISL